MVIENNRTHGLEMTAFEFAYDNGCAVNIKHRRYVPNVAVGEIVRYKHATRTVNRVSPIDDTDVSKARKPSRTGVYRGCAKRAIQNQAIERESELRYGVHRIGRIPPVDNSLNWVCCSPRDKEMSFTEDDRHLSELSGHDAGGMTGSEADSE